MRIDPGSVGSVVIVGTPSVSIAGGTLEVDPTDDLARLLGITRDELLYRIVNAQGFVASGYHGNVAGQYSHLQLLNPVGSGKTVIVKRVIVAPDANAIVSVNSYATALGSSQTIANLDEGGAAPSAQCLSGANAAQLGSARATLRCVGSTPTEFYSDWNHKLGAGEGIVVVGNVVNQGMLAYFILVEF